MFEIVSGSREFDAAFVKSWISTLGKEPIGPTPSHVIAFPVNDTSVEQIL
jgi:hypothetical protein